MSADESTMKLLDLCGGNDAPLEEHEVCDVADLHAVPDAANQWLYRVFAWHQMPLHRDQDYTMHGGFTDDGLHWNLVLRLNRFPHRLTIRVPSVALPVQFGGAH